VQHPTQAQPAAKKNELEGKKTIISDNIERALSQLKIVLSQEKKHASLKN
jgi:hypothetical protein